MKNLLTIILFFSSLNVYGSLQVDDSETGTTFNSLGGTWMTYKDGSSSAGFTPDYSPGYTGSYCRLFEWTYGKSSGLYAGAQTGLNSTWSGVNLSQYFGIRFYAKGKGRFEVTLPTDSTRTENNHYLKAINLTDEWKLYELPFSEFAQTWGTRRSWDPSTIYAVGFQAFGAFGMSGEIWIDDIEFFLESEAHELPDPNIILLEPKVNQIGYLPGEKKYFCVASETASAGDEFFIVDLSEDTVYSGTLSGSPVNDVASSGEFVWKIDFSSLAIPGTYKIKINGKESYEFKIEDNPYERLFKDALRCFYLIRCGIAEDDPVTGINRPACHINDAKIRGTSDSIDASGGWHNASDKGKYVNETAISVAYMLWLYELRGDALQNLDNNIPESGNGISDLLNEAKWGLTWLLKMQKDDGTVYHKADSEPNLYYCPEPLPDQDPFNDLRFVEFQKSDQPQIPSTIDAADLAAVMSQAARVFKDIDPSFADICLDAAQKSWTWVKNNKNTGQSDPYYIDSDPKQEYLWALGEMGRSLNSTTLRSEFSSGIDAVSLTHIGWEDPQLFGYLALYYDQYSDASLKNKIKNKIIALCNSIEGISESSGYGVALQSWEYWWESNEYVMSKADCLLLGYQITGNSGYKDAALRQLNYILGLNSLNKSFVMSHGSNPMMHPYNWIYSAYGKAIPGWMAGGPNSKIDGADVLLAEVIAAGTPSAKCYIDRYECGLGSWACNEGETSENSALVFLSGCFYNGSINPNVVQSSINLPLQFSLSQNFP
ncbi:MAG TPA: glycoside hydrolase family 9 protein, partial [Ignavibacteriaceae bacterium]|nr:glycoside hydrolase family 9 protein [Ignavibacteriaceae bacterium]